MLSKSLLLTIAIAVSAISGQKVDFKPINQVNNSENVGSVGKPIHFNQQLPENSTPSELFQPNTRNGLRTSVSSISKAKYYAMLAGATYCPNDALSTWSCKHCKNLSNGVTLQRIIDNSDHGTRAIITTNDKNNEIVVAFRGSVNNANWRQNLKTEKVPFEVAPNVAVHKGFKESADGLEPEFNKALTELLAIPKYRNYNVIVTGHSLGGAIATIAAIYINQVQELSWDRIQVYTYGVPRVGNLEFAVWYNQLPTTVTRVVNGNDDVPHMLSMASGYRHVFTEMYIHRGKTTVCDTTYVEDRRCSNSNVPFLATEPHHHAWDVNLGTDYC